MSKWIALPDFQKFTLYPFCHGRPLSRIEFAHATASIRDFDEIEYQTLHIPRLRSLFRPQLRLDEAPGVLRNLDLWLEGDLLCSMKAFVAIVENIASLGAHGIKCVVREFDFVIRGEVAPEHSPFDYFAQATDKAIMELVAQLVHFIKSLNTTN